MVTLATVALPATGGQGLEDQVGSDPTSLCSTGTEWAVPPLPTPAWGRLEELAPVSSSKRKNITAGKCLGFVSPNFRHLPEESKGVLVFHSLVLCTIRRSRGS